jgi:hypothetical protein
MNNGFCGEKQLYLDAKGSANGEFAVVSAAGDLGAFSDYRLVAKGRHTADLDLWNYFDVPVCKPLGLQ